MLINSFHYSVVGTSIAVFFDAERFESNLKIDHTLFGRSIARRNLYDTATHAIRARRHYQGDPALFEAYEQECQHLYFCHRSVWNAAQAAVFAEARKS